MKLENAQKYFDADGNIRVGRIEWGRDTIRPTPVDVQHITSALEGCLVLFTMPLEDRFGTAYIVSHPDFPGVPPGGTFGKFDVILIRDEFGVTTREKFTPSLEFVPGKPLEV